MQAASHRSPIKQLLPPGQIESKVDSQIESNWFDLTVPLISFRPLSFSPMQAAANRSRFKLCQVVLRFKARQRQIEAKSSSSSSAQVRLAPENDLTQLDLI